MIKKPLLTLGLIFWAVASAMAHPTGNLIVVQNTLYWSYIDPVDDPAHHACVMMCEPGQAAQLLIRSDFAGSDFMLYANSKDEIYIIERKILPDSRTFQIRVLKMCPGEHPKLIWNWMDDPMHIGEGGFMMPDDETILFVHHPSLYQIKKGSQPQLYKEWVAPLKRMRAIENQEMLLLSDGECWRVNSQGKVLQHWDSLLDPKVRDAPLGRNQIFDLDYQNGRLLIAYWGKRSFEVYSEDGASTCLLQQKRPYAPHWVAMDRDDYYLFSSKLIFDGSNPQPALQSVDDEGNLIPIWSGKSLK